MRKSIRTLRGALALLVLALILVAAGAAAQEAADEPETKIRWTTSDAAVATVDELGNVTPRSPGVAIISAYRGEELIDQVTLTVSDLCPHCGGSMFDGSKNHSTKWSVFDPEEHYKCEEEVAHHCESCGRDFPCSLWGSHTSCAVCKRPWCDKSHGDHRLCPLCEKSRQCVGSHGIGKCVQKAKCGVSGHYVGDGKGPHKKCEYCGKWRCKGGNHKLRACGLHCRAELKDLNHKACPYGCGGFLCDGGSHGTDRGQCSYSPPAPPPQPVDDTCPACGRPFSGPAGPGCDLQNRHKAS